MLPLAPIKIGDWMVLLLGVLCITWITITLWQGGVADKAIIRSGGKIFSEVPLSRNQIISVPGPLGISRITILAVSQHLPACWFRPVTRSIFGAFGYIAGQLLLVYFWPIPHTGLVYLIPIFAAAELPFGIVNGLIVAHYLDAPHTELEAPILTG